jgi:Glutaminase
MAWHESSTAGWLEDGRLLDRVAGAVRGVLSSGRVTDEIPMLARADPRAFGLAVATVDGDVRGVGEWRQRFSLQSISKVSRSPWWSPKTAMRCGPGWDTSRRARRSIRSFSSSTSMASPAIRSSTPARWSSPTAC